MNLKVKDFAALQGVSESIIYRHIRQHREALGDNVIKQAKATWLTDEGQEFIRGLMVQPPPPAVMDSALVDALTAAKAEIERLHKKLEATQDKLTEAARVQGLLEAEQKQRKLLEESRDEYKELVSQKSEELGAVKQVLTTTQQELAASKEENTRLKNRNLLERVFRIGE